MSKSEIWRSFCEANAIGRAFAKPWKLDFKILSVAGETAKVIAQVCGGENRRGECVEKHSVC